MAGYPNPPHEPPGGWKNDAQWIGNVQRWAEDMARMGFDWKDVYKIYQDDIGEPFPRNLKNTLEGNDWLFPGQNAMYEYDLQNQRRRHYTYNDPEHPGQQKGPFQWEDMSAGEQATAAQYYGWRNDPRNAWMFGATAENPEGHPYLAWLQQWGERWKDPNWTPPKASGMTTPTKDIFGRPGYDASGRKIATTTSPVTPGMPPLITPGLPGGDRRGDRGRGQGESVSQTSAANIIGTGGTLPKLTSNTGPTIPNMEGWGNLGLNAVNNRRRKLITTPHQQSPFFTF